MKIFYLRLHLFLILFISLYTLSTYPSNLSAPKNHLFKKGLIAKCIDYYARSKVIEFYNNLLHLTDEHANAPLASDDFQQWIKTAQQHVGINSDKMVNLRTMTTPKYDFIASFKHIYFNEPWTRNTYLSNKQNQSADEKAVSAYGILNCNFHHEATHIKYNDRAVDSCIRVSTLFSSLFITPLAIKIVLNPHGLSKLLYGVLPASVFAIGNNLSCRYCAYREHRADVEGHYATCCYKCVAEKAHEVRTIQKMAHQAIEVLKAQLNTAAPQESSYKTIASNLAIARAIISNKSRYLSADDNDAISRDLQKSGALCTFHQNSF